MFTTKNLFTLVGKHLLIALGFLVVALVAVFFFSSQITKISAKAVKDRHLAAQLSERTALLSSLKHETELIGSNDIAIKHAFIPTNNILEFVGVIENLAFKNGLMQAYNFSAPTPVGTAGVLPLATISYQDTISSANVGTLIKYLKEFEQLPYFTKIDSLSISAGGTDWRTAGTVSFGASVTAQIVE